MRKKILPILLTVSLCIGYVLPNPAFITGNIAIAEEGEREEAVGLLANYHSQEDIKGYINGHGATTDKLQYEEDQEPVTDGNYAQGVLKNATVDSALAIMNQIRYIAGLPEAAKSPDATDKAQAAALVSYINGKIAHDNLEKPAGMDDTLYNKAVDGAAHSIIANTKTEQTLYSLKNTFIHDWMKGMVTEGASDLENRSKILDPAVAEAGFGAVFSDKEAYSVLYASASDTDSAQEAEAGIAWPAQNMPVDYFGAGYLWSVFISEEVESSNVKVTLTRKNNGENDETWEFSGQDSTDGTFSVSNASDGQAGYIAFCPSNITEFNDGDIYHVEIITGPEEPQPAISYDVHFFDLEEPDSGTTTPTPTPTAAPSTTPSADPSESPSTSPSVSPSASPDASPSASPDASPSASPGESPSPSPTVSPTPVPTALPTPRPTNTPMPVTTPRPTATPYPPYDEVWPDDRDLQEDNEVWPDNPSGEDYEQDNNMEDDSEYSDITTNTPGTAPTDLPEKGQSYSSAIAKYVVTKSDAANGTVSYKGPVGNLSSVSIPYAVRINGIEFAVTAIANNAFKNNKTVESISGGSNITKIGNNAFSGCTNLKSLALGSKVKSIGNNAFKNCKKLTSLTLPAKVNKIGKKAFAGCSKLKSMTVLSEKLKASAIGSKAFAGIPKKAVIRVPKKKADAYRKLFRKKGLKKQVTVKKK